MAADAMMSLQAIRAKLQLLQTHGTAKNSDHLLAPTTTTSTHPRTADLTDTNSSGSFLLSLRDGGRPTVDSHSQHAHAAGKEEVVKSNAFAPHHQSVQNPASKSMDTGELAQQQQQQQQHLVLPWQMGSRVGSATPLTSQHSSSFLNRTAELTDKNTFSGHLTSEHTATTFEVEDHKARMRKIVTKGNCPKEWKTYIDFLKSVPSEGDIRIKPLSEAYSKAFDGILGSREHRNEEAVRVIMDYVCFCRDQREWDTVESILDLARGHIQGYAIIAVACAEFKMQQGDHEKAMSILTKSLAKGKALPKELLVRAIKTAEAGSSPLLSDQERRLEVQWVLGRQNHFDTCTATDEFKMPPPATGYTDGHTDMVTESADMSSASVSASDWPVFTHTDSASKDPLQSYSNMPKARFSAAKLQMNNSKLKDIIGKPMRVRNAVQQHPLHMLSKEKEEDTDFVNSVKPFNTTRRTSGRFASLASSGYLSDMTIPTEDPAPTPVKSSADKVSQSIGSSTAEQQVLSQHVTNQAPMPSHHAPVIPPNAPAPAWSAPVMTTPSCKGPQMQPSVAQTPSGEPMKTVTVNGEQYCILKKVGRGGSAQVYMVFDDSKNIRALKVVDLEGAAPEVVDGFRNEIHLLQRLQYCDSVIKMYNFELNKEHNCLYVLLEYGETDLSGFFTTRAKQKEGLDLNLIKFYWGEMLRAVNALHKEGIIHSDLKPANFMLVSGNLKLIDFGIANALQQDKTSVLKESRVGTPSYMSPEAIMAACDDCDDDEEEDSKENSRPKFKVGVRSDVWSLGCILYNMVYGRTPFQHIKNNMGKLQAITNPSHVIKFPNIPDPLLLDVLKKCLTREVKLRPTTLDLIGHPYLTKSKEAAECQTPPPQTANSAAVGQSATSGANPAESRRLQELLKSLLVQGSPRTAVRDLLQQVQSAKQ